MDRFSPSKVHGGGRLCGVLLASLFTSMTFAGQWIQHGPFHLSILPDHTCVYEAELTPY
ncbi:hypothetical protein BDV40DRAFT_283040 [Aspergillus tamarii]|uniref:Uncharacterized protein n=1 Tax=Aspergillus tamarii TaxID=41984 RepID=A0A5N6UAY1_ASPTM|nr:hypothetical protein BDV40DRAFT_283040 [Aspergillus tamarii]